MAKTKKIRVERGEAAELNELIQNLLDDSRCSAAPSLLRRLRLRDLVNTK